MKKFIVFIITALVLTSSLQAQKSKKKDKNKGAETPVLVLANEIDSVSYALGVNIGRGLTESKLTQVKPDLIAEGMKAILGSQTPVISEEQANELIRAYVNRIFETEANAAKAESEKFLQENKSKPGVVSLPSGLQYIVMQEGTGAMPKETDYVTTHYTGMTPDGKIFDSSYNRGEPATFPVNGVIKGWTEALQLMKVGSKWKLFIPADLAYGENPPPGSGIQANQTLIFEVELISIDNPAEQNPTENQ